MKNAFYYWRSTFELSENDVSTLQSLHVRTLYVKFFDIIWDTSSNQAIPIAITQFITKPPPNIGIVPTVFLTNDTLQHLPFSGIQGLAENLLKKVQTMLAPLDTTPIQELQLDCDWTTTTREKYFTLLQAVQTASKDQGILLSATIRLLQIKYAQKTGIPPVSKGMLMCYNMGTPTTFDTQNSILQIEVVEQYITQLDRYPLPLDVVLPTFSWGVLFYHQKFIKLIPNVREENFLDHQDFKRYRGNVFQAQCDTYLKTQYVYKDSLIRVEEAPVQTLQHTAELLAERLPNTQRTVAFFHYEPQIFLAYTQQDLLAIYSIF